MKKLGNIISEGSYINEVSSRQIFKSKCTSEYFRVEFIERAKKRLYGDNFVVDANNKRSINQLFYYLTGSPEFEGNLSKGILLIGNIGNGKTVLMESFIDVFNDTSDKIITCIHAKDIALILAKKDVGYLNKRPLFIDDIGKEQESIKNFGTVIHPLEDVINERYKNFGLTFGTSNYKLEDLPYSKHMIDRMKQMFNIMTLYGNSRR